MLGYLLATEPLLPLLAAAGRARVVNVASQLARRARPRRRAVRAAAVRRPRGVRAEQAGRPHAELGARPAARAGSGVTVNALHPGFVATEIFAKGGGLVGLVASLYSKLRARTPEQGADTVVYLAASPDVEGRTGLFWVDRQERRCRFRDEAQEEALYALCEGMTRIPPAIG